MTKDRQYCGQAKFLEVTELDLLNNQPANKLFLNVDHIVEVTPSSINTQYTTIFNTKSKRMVCEPYEAIRKALEDSRVEIITPHADVNKSERRSG